MSGVTVTASSLDNRRISLLLAVTDQQSTIFLKGQIHHLRSRGFDVTLISSPGPIAEGVVASDAPDFIPVRMQREISPIRDVLALARVILILLRLRPRIVNGGTPKAGMLLVLAGRVTFRPLVIYTLRGLRLETARGTLRVVLKIVEKLVCSAADVVVCNSRSLANAAVEAGVVRRSKVRVLGAGSSNGVDTDRYRITPELSGAAAELRQTLGIRAKEHVVGYVGRLATSKGLAVLLNAWELLRSRNSDVVLLLVGEMEVSAEALPSAVQALLDSSGILLVGQQPDVRTYLATMDLLVLPSFREGFPNVVLEAAAMEIPTVTTRASGCVDSVDDGKTGLLVDVGDASQLAEAIEKYLNDGQLRQRHGKAARERVLKDFRREKVWSEWENLYRVMGACE
jgi:glycosyltransferase involved in cell wall biosynthesis